MVSSLHHLYSEIVHQQRDGSALYSTRSNSLIDAKSPFCVVHLKSEAAAKSLMRRCILGKAIYEILGIGACYEDLHISLQQHALELRAQAGDRAWKMTMDAFQGSRTTEEKVGIIESFAYLDFQGPIRLKDPDEEYVVFEEYPHHKASTPRRLFLGRKIADGGREAINTLSLKQRQYISTTTMDAELALVAANVTLAKPQSVLYDPFVGTGSLILAGAYFGALVFGSDIDGRSMRGTREKNLRSNFQQYNLESRYLDSFVSDLTHSPLRKRDGGWIDAIVCDPPYGVREGLRVLGSRDGTGKEASWVDGAPAHL